jgi:hypothetical protein
MNKRLPYEEELSKQLNDLPLPDEQGSWDDMKRRLDEDNDDGIIIPPVKKGCMGYGLLLLLLAIILVLVVKPYKWLSHRKEKNIVSSEIVIQNKDEKNVIEDKGMGSKNITKSNNQDSVFSNNKKSLIIIDTLKPANDTEFVQKSFVKEATMTRKKLKASINNNKIEKNNDQIKENRIVRKNIAGNLKSSISNNQQNEDSTFIPAKIVVNDNDSSNINNNKNPDLLKTNADSNNINKKIKNADSTNKNIKKDSSIKPLIYFSAGLGLHQQLPINGEKLTPYNSLGRKSSLADYIPSVYFRMYKENKWFIQSEFRYGAPQYTKEILYIQKKVLDTLTNTTTSTSNRLKKTFYHQLPVSFNYFVLPHFSIGAGFTWNKFSSAIIEQEVKETNNITMVDSNQVLTILHSKKSDSNFVKSYFQALIETQYEWKRFSFGARYSFGLQPYLKFQLPGGQQQEEKNDALQIFIRYNLWQSKKDK